jgi:hypothetical protein
MAFGLRALAVFLLPWLAGCSSLITQSAGAGGGVGGAAIANAITKNGAITAGIGLGAQAAAITGAQILEKRVHAAEQDAIASAAAPVPVGGIAPWRITHTIPIETNEHGELTVVQDFAPALPEGAGPGFDCKLIIFSVDTRSRQQIQRNFYTTYVCRDGATWKWATAEPATARWGFLQ